ncbi:Oxidoreductase/transition metal ion-binding protein [Quillaja saponaria]|uniref:Oxidoreductase/transition metal ion-binding protein n=1 Tax=Quillaja saponaria TaxID=32244 RepID=A0AAD7PBG2_QUISA|nr:Oxidoreductase/transition metal ion-binding protein [Quillaja saponaria]
MASYYSSSSNSQSTLPLHLCFFLLVLFTFVGFSWYSNFEPMIESLMEQVKMFLIVSPLVLLLVLHLLSNYYEGRRGVFWSFIPLPERDSLHRAGGTPWGVGFMLVLLLFMISYQSSLKEILFPLLGE